MLNSRNGQAIKPGDLITLSGRVTSVLSDNPQQNNINVDIDGGDGTPITVSLRANQVDRLPEDQQPKQRPTTQQVENAKRVLENAGTEAETTSNRRTRSEAIAENPGNP